MPQMSREREYVLSGRGKLHRKGTMGAKDHVLLGVISLVGKAPNRDQGVPGITGENPRATKTEDRHVHTRCHDPYLTYVRLEPSACQEESWEFAADHRALDLAAPSAVRRTRLGLSIIAAKKLKSKVVSGILVSSKSWARSCL